jgi:hypothetical protein
MNYYFPPADGLFTAPPVAAPIPVILGPPDALPPPEEDDLVILLPVLFAMAPPEEEDDDVVLLPCANACCTKIMAKNDATSIVETTVADSAVSYLLNIR